MPLFNFAKMRNFPTFPVFLRNFDFVKIFIFTKFSQQSSKRFVFASSLSVSRVFKRK
jgi:hypothetical protein